ncbi:MAG: DUF5667 domain-containing protein, partial [Mycobacteriales bacterium]
MTMTVRVAGSLNGLTGFEVKRPGIEEDTVVGTAKQADRFAALLDGSAHAGSDPALARLAGLTQRLATLPLRPPPPLTGAGRTAVLAAAAAGAATGAAGARLPHARAAHTGALHAFTTPAWLPAVSGALAAAVAVTGVGVAAHRSLPGDPFYGLQRAVQLLQVDVAGGGVARAQERLAIARTQLAELAALSHEGGATPARVEALLGNWVTQVNAAGAPLARASAVERARLTAFLSAEQRQLVRLLPALPAATSGAVSRALQTVRATTALLAA